MKKYALILIGVIIGAPIGYYGVEILFAEQDRAKTMLNLFERYCVPWLKREIVKPELEVIELPHLREETFWVEPSSYSAITIRPRSCSVSDMLRPMSADERNTLRKILADFVASRYPMLHTDSNHGLDTWDEVNLWMEHPVGDDRRWGISLMRFQSAGEYSATSIQMHRSERSPMPRQENADPTISSP